MHVHVTCASQDSARGQRGALVPSHKAGREQPSPHHPRPHPTRHRDLQCCLTKRSDRFGTGQHRLGIQNPPAGRPSQITDHTRAPHVHAFGFDASTHRQHTANTQQRATGVRRGKDRTSNRGVIFRLCDRAAPRWITSRQRLRSRSFHGSDRCGEPDEKAEVETAHLKVLGLPWSITDQQETVA